METIKKEGFSNKVFTESEIIRRILSGEKELYEILVRRNNQKLYRVIRSYIRDQAEIEDIMQNTYLKGYEKLYQFRQASSYTTWLIRIGINEALARLKEKGRVYILHGNDPSFESNKLLEMPDKDQLNPEKRIIRKEIQQLMERTIDSLETKYKTIYILREIEEMSIDEISECLEISPSNVKVRLHRAKGMLKEKLYELTLHKDLFEFGYGKCDKITGQVMELIR